MGKPITTWKESVKKTHCAKGEPEWLTCKFCGESNLVYSTIKSKSEFVCRKCGKRKEKLVSMRCLKHKKRLNVPAWWPEVSKYLCPSCYEGLGEKKRREYVLAGGVASIRGEYAGRRTVYPSKDKTFYFEQKRKLSEEKDSTKKTSLEEFRPRYSLRCQKCGQVVKCHYSWFDYSTVLCPECYSNMSYFAVVKFHQMYKADKPDIGYPGIVGEKVQRNKDKEMPNEHSRSLDVGVRWSNSHVMMASDAELRDAVQRGSVSRMRARIEFRRRANSEYYDMLPEELGTKPIFY